MLENFQGNVYFAGRRMTVDKCIILDYYVAVLLQFLNVHFPMGSLAQWGTRGLSCLSLRFESHASLVLFSTSFNFFFYFYLTFLIITGIYVDFWLLFRSLSFFCA